MPTRTTPERRWPTVLAVALLVVLGAEILARVVMTRLPDPLFWASYENQRKVEDIDELSPTGCVHSVVFGSSIADSAIDAGLATELTGDRFYNAALGGSDALAWLSWADEVVIPGLCPQQAFVAIGLREVNGSADGGGFVGRYETSLGRRERRGELRGWQWAKKEAWNRSALFALQRSFRRPADAGSYLLNGSGPWREVNDDYGTLIRFHDRSYDDNPARRRFDREVVFASYEPRQPRLDTLGDLADRLAEADVDVVFVLVPHTAETLDYLDDGTDDVDDFVAAINELATSHGASVIDLLDITDDRAHFADDYHVNGAGASIVTRALVERR